MTAREDIGAAVPFRLWTPSRLRTAVDEVAVDLIGARLVDVDGGVEVEIVEVEAYGGPEDTASHARFGSTARNQPMWGEPGRLYVYLCYGVHRMLNIVTGDAGAAAAVLVRGARAIRGREVIARRRRCALGADTLAGPGKVAQALGIELGHNGHQICENGGVELREGTKPKRVLCAPRVGIDFAAARDRRSLRRYASGDGAVLTVPRSFRVRRSRRT